MASSDVEKNSPDHEQPARPVHQQISLKFKAYVVVSMTVLWSTYSVMIRYTRTLKGVPMYHSTSVVVCSEITKLFLASVLLFQTHNWSRESTIAEFKRDFLGKPRDLLKMSVPSLVYALQNNLDFVALSNLDAGVYQVTTQLKVVTTAVFMVLMLGKRYSPTRWFAIVLCFGGVAMVQLDAVRKNGAENAASEHHNYFIGIVAVLTTCVTAGFAGVYFEKMLKNSDTSLWIRNIQMYSAGATMAAIGCILKDGVSIAQNGFFYGYTPLTWLIVFVLGAGGIFISMVMKYLDNLVKSFASCISISTVCLLSWYLFGTALGLYFVLGTVVVIGSILLYNYVQQ